MEIEGIHLTRYGNDYTVVEVQIGGIWYEVIREIFDNNYDHFVTAKGIENKVYRTNLDLLKEDTTMRSR